LVTDATLLSFLILAVVPESPGKDTGSKKRKNSGEPEMPHRTFRHVPASNPNLMRPTLKNENEKTALPFILA